eukprot:GILK01002665.1.p1 GENE.GILK01002665.1~~GILK01002665.1.p1  ORF type:complete len:206 (+),score=43.52 GILK01002665.1:45-620(+)
MSDEQSPPPPANATPSSETNPLAQLLAGGNVQVLNFPGGATGGQNPMMDAKLMEFINQLLAQQAQTGGHEAHEEEEEVDTTPEDPNAVKNSDTISCRKCATKILLPGKSTLIDKEIYLHYERNIDGVEGETESQFWLVTNMYKFENIAASKPVANEYKYLICANCEKEPIGVVYLNDDKKFYISKNRVSYE